MTIFREQSGRANGLRFDQDSNLIVCEMGNRRITAIDMRGRVTVLADRFEDNRFNSPNDLWSIPKAASTSPIPGTARPTIWRSRGVTCTTSRQIARWSGA